MEEIEATLSAAQRTALEAFFTQLPSNRGAFLEELDRLGHELVNLPAIHREIRTTSREFPGRTIRIKKLTEYATINAFGHFRHMREAVATSPPNKKPPWFEALAELIALPGSGRIDRELALVTALRESGGLVRSGTSGVMVDTFEKGGLDFLYANKDRYSELGLAPEAWLDEMTESKEGDSAIIPIERFLAFYFARLGLARHILAERIADEFFAEDGGAGDTVALLKAESEIAALSSIERRIWTALAFQASLGGLDLATVSVGGTGLRTILRAFHLANAPLQAIVNVPGVHASMRAVRTNPDLKGILQPLPREQSVALRFMRRLPQFFRLNIATKTAVIAETMARHAARAKAKRP